MSVPIEYKSQKPIRFVVGQRVKLCYQVLEATIESHYGYRPLNGDNEWVVKIDGLEGLNVAGDSEMFSHAP